MSSARIALIAAGLAAVFWAAKVVAITLAGGLGESPAEGPLFLLGLVSILVAGGSLGVALTSGRQRGVRVIGALVVIVGVMLLTGLASLVVSAVQPDEPHWVWGEINLWVGAVVVLAVCLATARRVGGNVSRAASA